jgi:hypothetical protein
MSFDNDYNSPQTLWVPKSGKSLAPGPYMVLSRDADGVVATTTIRANTEEEDSFSWLSSAKEFLDNFVPLRHKE